MKKSLFAIIAVFTLLVTGPSAQAWHDKTHLAVAKAAGYRSWYNAAGPDLAKIKAGTVESYNHGYNNNAEADITVPMVFEQIERYNKNNILLDAEGHLYGAIIGSLRAYERDTSRGKYAQYHLAYCAHYAGDLSQPLHNIPYDDFNRSIHTAADGIVEKTILDEPEKILNAMYPITLRRDHFENDLAKEIAWIANLSRKLGYRLRAENRNITKEEAYEQLGHSASLFKAILQYYHPE